MVATTGILVCSASEALTPKPSQRELHRRWLSAHTYQATCTSPLKVLCIMGPLHICRHNIPHHHPGAAQYTSCTLWPIRHRLHLWHSTAGIEDPSAEIFSVSLSPGYLARLPETTGASPAASKQRQDVRTDAKKRWWDWLQDVNKDNILTAHKYAGGAIYLTTDRTLSHLFRYLDSSSYSET